MPLTPLRPCRRPGCGKVTRTGFCDEHNKDTGRESATKRGYNARWQRFRKQYLQQHPLCRECEKADRISAATVIDHIIPHRGDRRKFWDQSNLQPMCKPCHDRKTATEDGGFGR